MKGLLKRNKKTFIFMTSLLLFLIGVGVIQEIVKNLKPFEDVPVVSVETKDENTEKLLQEIQQGCDEFWQLLKSLKQEKQKQV